MESFNDKRDIERKLSGTVITKMWFIFDAMNTGKKNAHLMLIIAIASMIIVIIRREEQ